MNHTVENTRMTSVGTDMASRVERATEFLNGVRLGTMVLPVAGVAAAVALGPVAMWLAGAATGVAAITTRIASNRKRDELLKQIEELRRKQEIPDSEAGMLNILARQIVSGVQPEQHLSASAVR